MENPKKKILLIDDDLAILVRLCAEAKRLGWEAVTARDGESGLETALSQRFDLIVTDLQMPKMDGHRLIEELGKRENPPKVIVITGHATLEAAVKCLRNGAADFLKKPFTLEEFGHAVERVSQKAGLGHAEPDWARLSSEYSLTKREAEILRAFFLTGKSNAQIAEDLFLSLHTVKSHLKSAFLKLSVDSRAELLTILRSY